MRNMRYMVLGCFLSALCFQLGCGRENQEATFRKKVLNPFLRSIGTEQWNDTEKYFVEDVTVSSESGENKMGKASALDFIRSSPLRAIPRESKTSQIKFLEIEEKRVVVELIMQGASGGDPAELITAIITLVWRNQDNQWLIKEIRRTIERKEY